MAPEKLSYADFLRSLELCPRLTVELILENNKGGIFLIRRDRSPFENYWHLPGGFLLKGEKIGECVKRIAGEEIGARVDGGEFMGLFEEVGI